jgi:hypothetical protein
MEVSGQLHTSADYPPPPGERAPGAHLLGGCVGPRAGLDAVIKSKIFCPYRESNRGNTARRYTD